eukprot:TRINITY_DN42414_c0_g1_i2.p1 TRINITY_DN42414_c0_g1~~TRINITY_DN42414_c0_g1_i2.p1  ORF type:complete len:114 (+),score=25.71 TRINITY_DN42414_c0_g1_i2:264-605(+)
MWRAFSVVEAKRKKALEEKYSEVEQLKEKEEKARHQKQMELQQATHLLAVSEATRAIDKILGRISTHIFTQEILRLTKENRTKLKIEEKAIAQKAIIQSPLCGDCGQAKTGSK